MAESAAAGASPEIHVLAGALVGRDGRVLIAQRPAGKAHAGKWEFPGGKKHPAERPQQGLHRELQEELGIEVTDARPLLKVRHEYPAGVAGELPRRVLIDAWVVTAWRGMPAGLDGQALRWVTPEELETVDLLEADGPLVTALRLPAVLARATTPDTLRARAARAPRSRERLGWWLDGDWDFDAADVRAVIDEVRGRGDVLLVGDAQIAAAEAGLVDGVVWSASARPRPLPPAVLAGVECSTLVEARAAVAAGLRFLCVRDAALDGRALEGLATVGLPLVVDATRPRDGGHDAATTKLWWR
ncbi:MAG: NUDIX domain-containing protein [Gammaproteobacteria bacterium]